MIITKLVGGLGNQLFQYAVGRRLSLHHKLPLKLDISAFETYKLFDYELEHFAIKAEIATNAEINTLRSQSTISTRLIRKVFPSLISSGYISERFFHFDPHILSLGNQVYFEGYWQSAKYFDDVADKIRNELTVNAPAKGRNKELIEEMDNSNSVVVHVRRGDYVTNTTANRFHGVCSLDYYDRAVVSVAKRVTRPRFYVFSDDPEWAKTNLLFSHPTIYVSHNNRDHGYEDLRLMSHGKHFILANSTFSWWGAWLSPNKPKIVITPEQWFKGVSYNVQDLIPDDWEQL